MDYDNNVSGLRRPFKEKPSTFALSAATYDNVSNPTKPHSKEIIEDDTDGGGPQMSNMLGNTLVRQVQGVQLDKPVKFNRLLPSVNKNRIHPGNTTIFTQAASIARFEDDEITPEIKAILANTTKRAQERRLREEAAAAKGRETVGGGSGGGGGGAGNGAAGVGDAPSGGGGGVGGARHGSSELDDDESNASADGLLADQVGQRPKQRTPKKWRSFTRFVVSLLVINALLIAPVFSFVYLVFVDGRLFTVVQTLSIRGGTVSVTSTGRVGINTETPTATMDVWNRDGEDSLLRVTVDTGGSLTGGSSGDSKLSLTPDNPVLHRIQFGAYRSDGVTFDEGPSIENIPAGVLSPESPPMMRISGSEVLVLGDLMVDNTTAARKGVLLKPDGAMAASMASSTTTDTTITGTTTTTSLDIEDVGMYNEGGGFVIKRGSTPVFTVTNTGDFNLASDFSASSGLFRREMTGTSLTVSSPSQQNVRVMARDDASVLLRSQSTSTLSLLTKATTASISLNTSVLTMSLSDRPVFTLSGSGFDLRTNVLNFTAPTQSYSRISAASAANLLNPNGITVNLATKSSHARLVIDSRRPTESYNSSTRRTTYSSFGQTYTTALNASLSYLEPNYFPIVNTSSSSLNFEIDRTRFTIKNTNNEILTLDYLGQPILSLSGRTPTPIPGKSGNLTIFARSFAIDAPSSSESAKLIIQGSQDSTLKLYSPFEGGKSSVILRTDTGRLFGEVNVQYNMTFDSNQIFSISQNSNNGSYAEMGQGVLKLHTLTKSFSFNRVGTFNVVAGSGKPLQVDLKATSGTAALNITSGSTSGAASISLQSSPTQFLSISMQYSDSFYPFRISLSESPTNYSSSGSDPSPSAPTPLPVPPVPLPQRTRFNNPGKMILGIDAFYNVDLFCSTMYVDGSFTILQGADITSTVYVEDPRGIRFGDAADQPSSDPLLQRRLWMPLNQTSALAVFGNFAVDRSLIVRELTEIDGPATIGGTVNATSITFKPSPTQLAENLTVSLTNRGGSLFIDKDMRVDDTLTVQRTLHVQEDMNVTGTVHMSGSESGGQIVFVDKNVTLYAESPQILHAPSNVIIDGDLTIAKDLFVNGTIFGSLLINMGHMNVNFSRGAGRGVFVLGSIAASQMAAGTYVSEFQVDPKRVAHMMGKDGLPIMVFFDSNSNLRFVHCLDTGCTQYSMSILATGEGLYPSILLSAGDGLPGIAYITTDGKRVRFGRCADTDCSGFSTVVDVEASATSNTFKYTVALVSTEGFPLLMYQKLTLISVVACRDVACQTADPPSIITPGPFGYHMHGVLGSDGMPLIVHYNTSIISVVRCLNSSCSLRQTFDLYDTTATPTATDGEYLSVMVGIDGNPIIAFYDFSQTRLLVIHCTTTSCSSFDTPVEIDRPGGIHVAIAMGSDFLPVISYRDESGAGALKFAHCMDVGCVQFTKLVAETGDTGYGASVKIGSDKLPAIAYVRVQNGNQPVLRFLHCSNMFCVPYFRGR